MGDHVHRHQNLDQWVLINADWYKAFEHPERILLSPLNPGVQVQSSIGWDGVTERRTADADVLDPVGTPSTLIATYSTI